MPDYISIDWQSDRIFCLEGVASGTGAKIRHCSQIKWPDDINPTVEPLQAGQWLKEEFSNRGFRARNVLVTLPRQEVMARNFSVPDVAEDQLPELVRLQAETISASSLDNQILDFLPMPRQADATSRQVLIVTLVSQKLAQIPQIIEEA